MPDAATTAVIRDLFAIAGIALAIGLIAYPVIRARSGLAWSSDGNVLARPYGWPDAVVALLLLALFVPITFPAASGVEHGNGRSEPMSASALLGGMLFMLLLALLVLIFLKIRGLNPAEMFGIHQQSARAAVRYGFIGFVVVYIVVFVLAQLVLPGLLRDMLPEEKLQEPVEVFQKAGGGVQRLLIAFAAAVMAPVAEETIFRGFLYGVIKRFTDRWFAAIFTSLCFACVHQHLGSTLPLFVLAMGFATAYEITGSLLVPMIMHSMFNGATLFFLSFLPHS
jgi:membrane protease YdiL (CAAX protease family)